MKLIVNRCPSYKAGMSPADPLVLAASACPGSASAASSTIRVSAVRRDITIPPLRLPSKLVRRL